MIKQKRINLKKLIIIIALILIPFSLSTRQSSLWRYDWRLNDLRNSKYFTKQDLKVKCFFGFIYYTYKEESYVIPVLDRDENLVRCYY